MLDVGGGILFAVVVLVGSGAAARVAAWGWGQWRCLLLGHRWVEPSNEGGMYGTAYRTTGTLSWRARAHCGRCDSYVAFTAPDECARRFVARKTWQGSAPR